MFLKHRALCFHLGAGQSTNVTCIPHACRDEETQAVSSPLPRIKTDELASMHDASAAAASDLKYCYINSDVACPKSGHVQPPNRVMVLAAHTLSGIRQSWATLSLR